LGPIANDRRERRRRAGRAGAPSDWAPLHRRTRRDRDGLPPTA